MYVECSSQHQISKYLALGLTVHTYSVTTGCFEASEWAGSKSYGFCVGVTTMELENCQDGHAVQPVSCCQVAEMKAESSVSQ